MRCGVHFGSSHGSFRRIVSIRAWIVRIDAKALASFPMSGWLPAGRSPSRISCCLSRRSASARVGHHYKRVVPGALLAHMVPYLLENGGGLEGEEDLLTLSDSLTS